MFLWCLIFMNSKGKTFSVWGWHCCVRLIWLLRTSLLHRLKWEMSLWGQTLAPWDVAVMETACSPNATGSSLQFLLCLEVMRRAGGYLTDEVLVVLVSQCAAGVPTRLGGLFTGSTPRLSLRAHRRWHIFPIMGFKFLSPCFLRNIFDIVTVEATGAFFDPGVKLTQLCFAQFYLETMTTTSEMLFVNAILLHYLLLHLLNTMVPAAKIPLSDSSSCQSSYVVFFKK